MSTEIEPVKDGQGGISLQVIQDVYNDLTGKTEHTARLFFEPHIVHLSDLEHLHTCIEQTIEQYSCVSSSCMVSVRYCDGKSERFSGFSKFKTQGLNRSLPTTEVEIEYDFLICLPRIKDAKPYKITIGVRSGLGVVRGFKVTNATDTEQRMYFGIQSGTARLEIHYVDLAVARSIEATIEEWYRGLKKAPFSKTIDWVRGNARWVPSIFRAVVILGVFFICYKAFSLQVNSQPSLFRALMFSAALCTLVVSFSLPFGSWVQQIVERSKPASVVILSRADGELYDEKSSSSWWSLGKALAAVISGVLISLISAYIALRIGIN